MNNNENKGQFTMFYKQKKVEKIFFPQILHMWGVFLLKNYLLIFGFHFRGRNNVELGRVNIASELNREPIEQYVFVETANSCSKPCKQVGS